MSQFASNAMGSQTYLLMLSAAFDVGFIVFTSREQGNDQWMQYLNYPAASFPVWMPFCWDGPVRYRLPELTESSAPHPTTFYLTVDIRAQVLNHRGRCNAGAPIFRGVGQSRAPSWRLGFAEAFKHALRTPTETEGCI